MNDIQKQYSPYYVSVNWRPEEDSKEEFLAMLSRISTMPLAIRKGLRSEKTAQKVRMLADQYQIDDEGRVGEISRIIRDIFVDKISGQVVLKRVVDKLKISTNQQKQFIADLKTLILEIKKVAKAEKERVIDEVSLEEAIKKYGDKFTGQRLTLESLDIPELKKDQRFPPTIKNWLEDYIQKKGAQKHALLERNNYLFESQNARKLLEEDRDKLSMVLESYDEKTKLPIYKSDNPFIFFDDVRREAILANQKVVTEKNAAQIKPLKRKSESISKSKAGIAASTVNNQQGKIADNKAKQVLFNENKEEMDGLVLEHSQKTGVDNNQKQENNSNRNVLTIPDNQDDKSGRILSLKGKAIPDKKRMEALDLKKVQSGEDGLAGDKKTI